jgi:hypothetical protein
LHRPFLAVLSLTLATAAAAAAQPAYTPDFSAAQLASSIPGLSEEAMQAVLGRIGTLETVSPILSEEGAAVAEANAFLISPCYALANEHAALGDDVDAGGRRTNRAVKLKFGTRAGGWMAGKVVRYDGPSDFVLIRIDQCPGRALGWLAPDTRSPQELGGVELYMAGFRFDDEDRATLTLARCRARAPHAGSGAQAAWIHDDCPSEDGVSGSALLTQSDGAVRVAALHVGVFPGDEPKFGVALSLASVLADPQVAALITADIAADQKGD